MGGRCLLHGVSRVLHGVSHHVARLIHSQGMNYGVYQAVRYGMSELMR